MSNRPRREGSGINPRFEEDYDMARAAIRDQTNPK